MKRKNGSAKATGTIDPMTRTKDAPTQTLAPMAPFFVPDSAVLTLGDLWKAVRRFMGRAVAVFLSCVAIAFASLYVWPRTYSSEAKLYIKIGRDTATIDAATAAAGPAINVLESRQNEINSILEVMRSRELAERTVKRVGAETILEGKLPDPEGATSPATSTNSVQALIGEWVSFATSFLPSDPISKEEQAIHALGSSMGIGSARSSSIATVSYESKSPEAAQKILSAFLDEFSRLQFEALKSKGTLEFFEKAVAQSDMKVRDHSEKLREAKKRVGAASLDGKRKLLEDELAAIRLEIVKTRASLAESTHKAASYSEKLIDMPEKIVSQETNGIGNAGVENMRDRLYQLEISEAEAKSKLSPQHPRMVALKKAREDSEKILGSTKDARTHVMTSINEVRQQLELSLLSEQANLDSLSAKISTLGQQEQDCLNRIAEFGKEEIELTALQRDLQTADAAYHSHYSRLEQSRIGQELEEQQITNVNIYQPASLSLKPTSPKKPMVLGLGAIFGMFAAVSVALISHAADRTLKSREDIESVLQAPVLANIPKSQWLASRWR